MAGTIWAPRGMAVAVPLVCLLAALQPALGQAAPGGAGGGHHGGGHHGSTAPRPGAAAPDAGPKLVQDPIQRLDAGALLCKTEAALQQHVAAIEARLNGQEADEPAGCHLVQTMTAVSVVEHPRPDITEVRAGKEIGWTDSLVRTP